MNDRVRLGLIVAVVAVLLAAPAVLIVVRAGSGSAAFGDVEQVGRNRVSAATLDIAVGSRTAPINVADLAPGDLVSGQVELYNAGTLPLRYALEVDASTPAIADQLTWWFSFADDAACPGERQWRAGPDGSIELAGSSVAAGVAISSMTPSAGTRAARVLDIGERDVLCLAVELDRAASNAAQDTTVDLRLIARAEQVAEPAATDATDAVGEERS